MNPYRETFKHRALIIVIGGDNVERAVKNIRIAKESGASGVFLTNDFKPSEELLKNHEYIRNIAVPLWIGLYLKNLPIRKSLTLVPNDTLGLWSDDRALANNDEQIHVSGLKRNLGWKGIHFESVGSHTGKNFDKAVVHVTNLANVLVVKSASTGVEPEIQRLRTARELSGNHPIAIAGGMHSANIERFVDLADCFIIKSSVTNPDHLLNGYRIERIARTLERAHV